MLTCPIQIFDYSSGLTLDSALANTELSLYLTPWARFQTYGIGLLAGCILVNLQQNNYKMPIVSLLDAHVLRTTI